MECEGLSLVLSWLEEAVRPGVLPKDNLLHDSPTKRATHPLIEVQLDLEYEIQMGNGRSDFMPVHNLTVKSPRVRWYLHDIEVS